MIGLSLIMSRVSVGHVTLFTSPNMYVSLVCSVSSALLPAPDLLTSISSAFSAYDFPSDSAENRRNQTRLSFHHLRHCNTYLTLVVHCCLCSLVTLILSSGSHLLRPLELGTAAIPSSSYSVNFFLSTGSLPFAYKHFHINKIPILSSSNTPPATSSFLCSSQQNLDWTVYTNSLYLLSLHSLLSLLHTGFVALPSIPLKLLSRWRMWHS